MMDENNTESPDIALRENEVILVKPKNHTGESPWRQPVKPLRLLLLSLFTIGFILGLNYLAMSLINNNPDLTTINYSKRFIEIQQIIGNPGQVAFSNKEHLVILCLGLDENRDEQGIAHTKGSRTDTIILLSVDRRAKRMGILSIPRDTWVEINESTGYEKINSAYTIGFLDCFEKHNDYKQAKQAGILQARTTISRFLDVEIDHTVLLKLKACKELIDELGGLTIDVEKDMNYDDNWGNLHIHLKQGKQRLNGEQAVGYARFRHDEEGDWGRIRRQQQVIQALVNELKKPSHVTRINKLASVIKNNIETDLTLTEIIDLACVYKNFDRNNIVKGVIPATDDWAGGAMILVPIGYEKDVVVRKVLRDPSGILPEELKIKLVNGSSHPDACRKAEEWLKKEGFKIVEQTDSDPNYQNIKTTVIIDHSVNPKGALMLEDSLGIETKFTQQECEPGKEIDFTIVIGNDYVDHLHVRNLPSQKPTADNQDSKEQEPEIEGFRVTVTQVPVEELATPITEPNVIYVDPDDENAPETYHREHRTPKNRKAREPDVNYIHSPSDSKDKTPGTISPEADNDDMEVIK